MESNLYQALVDLKCPSITSLEEFQTITQGPITSSYTYIVSFLSGELQNFLNLEEIINPIDDNAHLQSFHIETSAFLKELDCPYTSLLQGPIHNRLSTHKDRLKLLDYLVTELQAAKISLASNDMEIDHNDKSSAISESPVAHYLRLMLMALSFPEPQPGIKPRVLFAKIRDKLKELMNSQGKQPLTLGQPLLKETLNAEEWRELDRIVHELCKEYKTRKDLLLTRVDLTVDSFTWSQRLKDKKGLIAEKYNPMRILLNNKVAINVADILAARDDLLHFEKTSDSGVRKNTRSKISQILIGRVPDRGGRPSETQAPPKEIPSYKKDNQSNQHNQNFSHNNQRGGSRVQGNWSGNNPRNMGGDFQRYNNSHQPTHQHYATPQQNYMPSPGLYNTANNFQNNTQGYYNQPNYNFPTNHQANMGIDPQFYNGQQHSNPKRNRGGGQFSQQNEGHRNRY
ncbi:unnamed protein product [Gordionus sp. m RMFG-2023]|uniref:protein FAM98A-like n=1 Tax=Gordionus sp. m RMFG-2023 TaxID=3053472 RepID=UPI0030E57A58